MAKCRHCKKPDAKVKAPAHMAYFCDYKCASEYSLNKVRREKEKEERRIKRDKLSELNETVKYWRPKAQQSFNTYIRYRDRNESCISCGRNKDKMRSDPLRGQLFDCGHYRSTGACPELRFCEHNAHKQCVHCNRDLSGNVVEYRKGLIKKYESVNNFGPPMLEWLESNHETPRWRWDDYKRIHELYKDKLKRLKERDKQKEAKL